MFLIVIWNISSQELNDQNSGSQKKHTYIFLLTVDPDVDSPPMIKVVIYIDTWVSLNPWTLYVLHVVPWFVFLEWDDAGFYGKNTGL